MTDSAARLQQILTAYDEYFGGPDSPLKLRGKSAGSTESWFLGPKAENQEVLLDLLWRALRSHAEFRRTFHPEDPSVIGAAVKRSNEYKEGVAALRDRAENLFAALEMSAPISSMRHHGHMLWDQLLAGTIGYFVAMLYNQNNVAAEASPVTTRLEIEVGNDLCRMLGFSVPADLENPSPAVRSCRGDISRATVPLQMSKRSGPPAM